MGLWANLGKNPYFEPFLLPNHPFLGLATFTKVDCLMKMCNFSSIKFSQKLGVQDLQNLVGPLREPTLQNKVLCKDEQNYVINQSHFSILKSLLTSYSLIYILTYSLQLKTAYNYMYIISLIRLSLSLGENWHMKIGYLIYRPIIYAVQYLSHFSGIFSSADSKYISLRSNSCPTH